MRSRIFVLWFCLCSSLLLAHTRRIHSHADDPAYVPALAAANNFLHAWRTQDHEAGLLMLTDAARQHTTPQQLESFFSSGPRAAFEIQHGKKLNAAQYAFPVVLFDDAASLRRAHHCRIVVIKTDKDEWVVDRLP